MKYLKKKSFSLKPSRGKNVELFEDQEKIPIFCTEKIENKNFAENT
jgi:hypothetical protein